MRRGMVGRLEGEGEVKREGVGRGACEVQDEARGLVEVRERWEVREARG